MKENLIENLNYRRYLLKNLIIKLKDKINITQDRLNSDLEKLSTYKNAFEIVNRQIIRTIKRGAIPKVEIIGYKDEKNKEKYMLKIDIDNSGKSIYKAINELDLMLYQPTGDIINDINYIHRIEELAFLHIANHNDMNLLFNDFSEEAETILDQFSNSQRIENRLENSVIRL